MSEVRRAQIKLNMAKAKETHKTSLKSMTDRLKRAGNRSVTELNKYTLAQYQNKAAGDLAMKAMDQGSGLKDRSTDANKRKIKKRMIGIGTAGRKLSGGGYTGGVGPESPTGKMHNEANHLANISTSSSSDGDRKPGLTVRRAMDANKGKSKSTITKGIYKRLAKDRGVEYPRRNKAGGIAASKIEEDQVNEVSKKTLGSYVDKAAGNLMKRAHITGMRDGSGRDPIGSVATAKRDKEVRDVVNRRAGIKGAARRLSKEEVDQVDELNVRTLRSYKDKAMDDYEDKVDPRKGGKLTSPEAKKRMQGIGRASDKIQTAKIMQRQRMGVNELKTPTLKRYLSKADDSVTDMAQDGKSATSKFNKRRLGMAKAQGRLSMNRQLGRAEESVQEDAELKKVASELEGASKKHLKQAQKVKSHVDKMGEENMNGLSIEQVYARQVAKQLLKMDEDMHDVDDSLPKDAKKKVMNGKDKYKGLDKANGDDDKDAVTSEGLSAKQKKLPPGLQKAIAAKAAKNEEVDEGVLGAVGGGIVGGMAGGPVGAALGAYAGHKMQQQKNKIKKLQKPKNEEVKVTQVPENPKHTAKMKKAAKMYKTVPASQRGTGSAGKRGGDSGFRNVKMGEEVDQLLDVTDIENLIVEDGHADVASARRKAALMVEDALQILMKLREMEPTDSMPSWWMNKMAVSSSMLDSARNYIVVPSMDQQPEIPEEVRLTDQEAEELAEGAIGATLGGIGGAALTGGPIGAGVGAVVGHKVEKGVRSVGRRLKQGYQAFKQKPKMEATDPKSAAKMIAKKAVSNAMKHLTSERSMMIITPMMKRKKVQQDVAAAGGLPTQSATSESVVQKYLKRD